MTSTSIALKAAPDPEMTEGGMYEVINLETGESHGKYESLDQAQGCVEFDKLTSHQIWRGPYLIEEHEPDTDIGCDRCHGSILPGEYRFYVSRLETFCKKCMQTAPRGVFRGRYLLGTAFFYATAGWVYLPLRSEDYAAHRTPKGCGCPTVALAVPFPPGTYTAAIQGRWSAAVGVRS